MKRCLKCEKVFQESYVYCPFCGCVLANNVIDKTVLTGCIDRCFNAVCGDSKHTYRDFMLLKSAITDTFSIAADALKLDSIELGLPKPGAGLTNKMRGYLGDFSSYTSLGKTYDYDKKHFKPNERFFDKITDNLEEYLEECGFECTDQDDLYKTVVHYLYCFKRASQGIPENYIEYTRDVSDDFYNEYYPSWEINAFYGTDDEESDDETVRGDNDFYEIEDDEGELPF